MRKHLKNTYIVPLRLQKGCKNLETWSAFILISKSDLRLWFTLSHSKPLIFLDKIKISNLIKLSLDFPIDTVLVN